MRRLIAKSIIILAIVCLLLVFANSYYCEHILQKDVYFSTSNRILEERPKFLVLGDSHAQAAFRSNVDKYMFGIAASGSDSLMDSYLKLEYLLERGYRPDFLLLEVDATVFASYRWRSNNRRYAFLIAEASLINELYNASYSDVQVFFYSIFPILEGSARQNTLRLFAENALRHPTANEATSWAFLSSIKRQEIAINRVTEQFASSGFNIDLARIFLKIVHLAESNGIEVIAIRYPLTKEYLNVLSQGIITHTNHMLVSSTTHLMDFSGVFIDNPWLFEDSDHLNEVGSEHFLALLTADLY